MCAVRLSNYGTTTRRPALPKRSWPKGWTSWRPFCNTRRGKTRPTSITPSISPTGSSIPRQILCWRPFGPAWTKRLLAALLLDPGGTKISSDVHDQLTHDLTIRLFLVAYGNRGQPVRDVQLSHRTICGRAGAPDGPPGAGGQQPHGELGRYGGLNVHARRADMTMGLQLRQLERTDEHGRDVLLLTQRLSQCHRVGSRRE